MFALAFLVVMILLFFGGVWARHRHGLEVTSAYRTDLALLSAGCATALVGVLVPAYVIVRRGVYGGAIGDNLPNGVSEDILLNLVIIGGAITIVAAINRYVDRIKSE